ncbi:MAG TPA: hypothetical protein VFP79_13680 [Pseudolabrys sp.]|nr:hypothetical protein [Pseudolabrys sp.]
MKGLVLVNGGGGAAAAVGGWRSSLRHDDAGVEYSLAGELGVSG